MKDDRLRLILILGAAALLFLPGGFYGPRNVLARGGEGIGLTAGPDSVANTPPDTTS